MFGQGQKRNVALPSHCLPLSFTLVTFDSFDHQDKNILSGNASAHDTAVTNLCRDSWRIKCLYAM